MTRKQYRLTRRLMMILAAAPMLQLSQCRTGTNQTLAFIGNQLPSTTYSLVQSVVLAPFYSLLSGGNVNLNFFNQGGGGI